MTYLELITNAYRLRNVIDATRTPNADQGASGITLLNQLMAELLADSVDLQYVPVTFAQIAGTMTIPVYAQAGITAALAIRITAGSAITPELQGQYDDGMATILRKAVAAGLQPPSMAHIPAGDAVRKRVGDFFNN